MAEPPAVPPELECLLQVSELRVKPTIESLRGFQRCCTYDLLGPAGNLMFQGIEQRELGGPRLELKVKNTQENNVLNLHVLSRIKSWDTKLQVSSSSGQLLGCIEKEWKSFSSRFDILDPSGDICLKVKGPGWGESMSDAYYQVLSADKKTNLGSIMREHRSFQKDSYTVSFPKDLHVTTKALLMSCTLFIDLLREEKRRES